MYPNLVDIDASLNVCVCAASNPTDIIEKSERFWTATSLVFKINADESPWPYSAEYPPVEKLVPLNIIGENLLRVGTFGMLRS